MLDAAVRAWRRRTGKRANKATAVVVRKARGSDGECGDGPEGYGRVRQTRARKRGTCRSKTRPTRESSSLPPTSEQCERRLLDLDLRRSEVSSPEALPNRTGCVWTPNRCGVPNFRC